MNPLESREFILFGWRLQLEEVSNNVYEIILIDEYLRKARTKDHDLERGIRQCAEYAFDIEKKLTRNWNKFLYETTLLELENESIMGKRHHEEAFGSWYVELKNERIIADGKESLLIRQTKVGSDWKDNFSFELKGVDYTQFLEIVIKKAD